MTMPFGKHRGCRLDELPDDYVEWLRGIDLRPRLREALEREWQARCGRGSYNAPPRHEAPLALPAPVIATARDIVNAGFRELARLRHPDHGGDDVGMRLVLEARDALRSLLA